MRSPFYFLGPLVECLKINIQNVEELVFHDKEAWRLMPDLIHLRDQWRVSKMTPMLRAMGRKALLDFLRAADAKHEEALSKRFGAEVTIDRLESHLVKNMEFSVKDECPSLDPENSYTGVSSFRRGDKVFLTFWR
jgi:hypothetical protein